jgi:hypothetical protein
MKEISALLCEIMSRGSYPFEMGVKTFEDLIKAPYSLPEKNCTGPYTFMHSLRALLTLI